MVDDIEEESCAGEFVYLNSKKIHGMSWIQE
jgi:hypothetical protein